MNPLFLKIQVPPLSSFSVRKETRPNINSRWHYHPEVELIHFESGEGMQFLGDDMRQFQAGDVVMVGPNVPHYWRFDNYDPEKTTTEYSTVIHFAENFLGNDMSDLAELKKIKTMIDRSRRGILLKGTSARRVAELMEKCYQTQGFERLIALMETLYSFAECEDTEMLCSIGFNYSASDMSDTRVKNVIEYTLQHLNEKICLQSVASIAGLTENSFCRFFKSNTGKTYFEFLTEARIGQACKLLMDGKLTIKEVCFNSGFDNLSCFFSKFKAITGKTPLQYKHEIV